MGTVDRKIKRFEQIAKADAMKIRHLLLTEVEDKVNSAIKVADVEYKREARETHIKVIEEAHKEAGYIMSTAQNAASNKLLKKRNEIVGHIFSELEIKLIEFTNTEQYKEYFKNKLDEALLKAKSIIGDRDYEISILLTEHDCRNLNSQTEEISTAYFSMDKVKVSECGENIIGGCIVSISKLKLKIDNTIKSYVDMEREAFLQDNELSLK